MSEEQLKMCINEMLELIKKEYKTLSANFCSVAIGKSMESVYKQQKAIAERYIGEDEIDTV
jgi:hypothetical protein